MTAHPHSQIMLAAIAKQITDRAAFVGATEHDYEMTVGGVGVMFTVYTTAEFDEDGGAACTVIGATAEDDNGRLSHAANRDELLAICGAREVNRVEWLAAEYAAEVGPSDSGCDDAYEWRAGK